MSVLQQGPISALPEEMLLAVLARLDSASTLGLAVPLVCRRWQRVAADPWAWASADLDVVTDPADSGGKVREVIWYEWCCQ